MRLFDKQNATLHNTNYTKNKGRCLFNARYTFDAYK